MKKVRLLVILFSLTLTFTACSTSDSLDQLIQDTEMGDIDTPENTDDDEEEGEVNEGNG